jgi:hypothetical protein
MNKRRAHSASMLLAALACSLVVTVAGAQGADSPYEFERGFPAADTAEKAYAAADLRRAIEAYKFGKNEDSHT